MERLSSTLHLETKMNYTKAVQTEIVPTKQQAVILDAIEGIPIQNYATAIGSKIGPQNIRFMSRIANNRVCIYVATKEIADTLIDTHKQVIINQHTILIRPLISRNKRLILSNVPPIIPQSTIIEKLKESGIVPMSNVTTLRAGLNNPGYQHILSFRRQLYIKPEDIKKIPNSWKIDFDETSYWIYPTLDNMLCFTCKEEGHLAKSCPTNTSFPTSHSINEPISTNISDTAIQDVISHSNPTPTSATTPTITPSQPEILIQNTTVSTKRQLSDSSSCISMPPPEVPKNNTSSPIKRAEIAPTKKMRVNSDQIEPAPLVDQFLQKINTIMSPNPSEYSLGFEQIAELFTKFKINKNLDQVLNECNIQPMEVITTLKAIYPSLKSKSHKQRLTSITNKLEIGILDDTASVTSMSSEGSLLELSNTQ